MGKIINFDEYKSTSEPVISIKRTEEFYAVAKELDNFIGTLQLNQSNNDRLVALIIKQVQAIEKGAFAQGVRMGINYAKWDMEHPEN